MPLSWSLVTQPSDRSVPQLHQQRLPLSGRLWLPFADLSVQTHPAELVQTLRHQALPGFVLRGCPPELLNSLQQAFSGQGLCTGREALLHLHSSHFERNKIQHLVRRGRRHGHVRELWLKESICPAEVVHLYQQVTSRYPAQLQLLYRRSPEHRLRLFGFESASGALLALISLSRSGLESWHTEQMLRLPSAPVGTMAALLAGVFETLQAEGARWWSLGEVPFYPLSPPQSLKERLLIQAGRSLEPVYSAQGLLQFKAKFRPWWRPVYLYGSPDLNWRVLWDMFHSSRCSALAWKALRKRGSTWLKSI